MEARLLTGDRPRDEELLDLLAGLGDEPTAVRRLTLLVYRDIEAAQRHLVDVFGLVAGELTRDGDGRVVHGEVFAGDGVIWMHQESEEFRLASPATSGHRVALHGGGRRRRGRAPRPGRGAGAEIVYEPTEMPYGVREYAARDTEGGLWSFMQPLTDRPRRNEMAELTPYLCVADGRAAIDWYVEVLGAEVTYEPIVMPDGRIGHVELAVDGAGWMMAGEFPDYDVQGPDPARGAAVTLHLAVDDVDALARGGGRRRPLDRGLPRTSWRAGSPCCGTRSGTGGSSTVRSGAGDLRGRAGGRRTHRSVLMLTEKRLPPSATVTDDGPGAASRSRTRVVGVGEVEPPLEEVGRPARRLALAQIAARS